MLDGMTQNGAVEMYTCTPCHEGYNYLGFQTDVLEKETVR